MKFIPILFSTPMVQAIILECKTITRRVVKSQPPKDFVYLGTDTDNSSGQSIFYACWEGSTFHNVKCPYGQPGDVLWVRETFLEEYVNKKVNGSWEPLLHYYYKADGNPNEQKGFDKVKWKPSLFMPKEACRIFLKIKSIRVENLQDISIADSIREGVETLNLYPGYDMSAKAKFEGFWNYINGNTDKSWNENPWVWVIEFERIERPSNFLLVK